MLLLIVFGIINFGLIFANQLALNSAARNAARAGVVQPVGGTGLTCAQVAAQARSGASMLGASTTSIAVTVTAPDGTSTCSLAVGSSTATESPLGTAAKSPCTGTASLTSPQLTVAVTYIYSTIGLFGKSTFTLTSKGSFLCEYN